MGGVLAPNGKIIFVPYASTYIGIYDPIDNSFNKLYMFASNSPYINYLKFVGGVLAPNGKIIFVPHRVPFIGIYDPDDGPNGSFNTTEFSSISVNSRFSGGVLAPNGKIIFAPSQIDHGTGADKIGIYNPINNVYSEGQDTITTSNTYKFTNGVLAPNGKIIFLPSKGRDIGIYDPITDNYNEITNAITSDSSLKFSGGVLAPNGQIIFVPFNATNVGIYGADYPLTNELKKSILLPYFNKY